MAGFCLQMDELNRALLSHLLQPLMPVAAQHDTSARGTHFGRDRKAACTPTAWPVARTNGQRCVLRGIHRAAAGVLLAVAQPLR